MACGCRTRCGVVHHPHIVSRYLPFKTLANLLTTLCIIADFPPLYQCDSRFSYAGAVDPNTPAPKHDQVPLSPSPQLSYLPIHHTLAVNLLFLSPIPHL